MPDSSKHGTIGSTGEAVCSCDLCPGPGNGSDANVVPAVTIGDSPSWCSTSKVDSCTIPTPTQNDVIGANRLSTKGFQIILFSGLNFGRTGSSVEMSELETTTFGPFTGREVSMPVIRDGSPFQKSVAACRVHEPSFSVACNTKPGIAGPHKWIFTVRGQSTEQIVETRYAAPNIDKISPILLNTDGSSTVFVEGTEFGTLDSNARFRVILTRGAPASSCVGLPELDCHSVAATDGVTLSSGKEQLRFNAPESFGQSWNLRLVVTNSLIAQSIVADYQSSDINSQFGYKLPSIETVEILPTGGSSLNLLTIFGSNFCNRNEQGCGSIYLCDKNQSNSSYCYENAVEIANVSLWSHSVIKTYVATTSGYIFIRVGATGIMQESARSNLAYFSTDVLQILVDPTKMAHTSFSLVGADIEYRGVNSEGVATTGGSCVDDSDQSCLKLTVSGLPDLSSGLNGPDGVKIHVGSIEYSASWRTKISDPTDDILVYEIKFRSPSGSGAKQSIKVCYGASCTQNLAFIYFARPVVENVRLSNTMSIYTDPGILPTTGANVTIVGRNLVCDPRSQGCDVENPLTIRWQSSGYYSKNLVSIDSSGTYTSDSECTSIGR